MNGSVIRIEIPMLPPKQLSPNARVHWSIRARYAGDFRTWSKYYVQEALRLKRPMLPKAEVAIKFIVPDKRHIRDTDNALAAVKPAIDGCVDAGVIPDDSPDILTFRMPVDWEVDKHKTPSTILTFTEME